MRQTHKEHMEYLKNHDPITYHELTGNPTGADSDAGSGCALIALSIAGIIGTIIYVITVL